ncbi:hypothetical protein [Nocardiopsis sp. CNR-923]|uniref:hypothetical protein n=1 Tax=Nocardiopsis sp. CNR-923 TaxID=1904965 RepID=UPI001300E8BB|nr:hypothetical protein [Nocardiopsis sp. CNR-923]
MDLRNRSISFDTYEGGAAAVRCSEIEHVTVLTPGQAAEQSAAVIGPIPPTGDPE